ncbi:MAG: hypothetical protein AB1Y25_10640 [Cycloclasticus sp.]
MQYNNIKKLMLGLALTATVCSSTMATTFIEKQQQELKTLRSQWQQKSIPSGMQSAPLRAVTERDSGADNVSIYIQNVNFDIVENIGFYVENLAASLEPKVAGQPVIFDDVESFTINVHSGSVVLSEQVIADLFNQHILDYWPRPMNDLKVKARDGYLEVEADIKLWSWFPGFWLPADLGGKIVLADDNKLVYEIDDVRLFGIPLFGLLNTLYIDLDLLLSVDRKGATLVDSVLILDHTAVFPPPSLMGRIETTFIDKDGLHLTFAANEAATFNQPTVESDSYIWMQSGDPRLFDIVVNNGTIQVVADDTSKPLRFNLYDYRTQVAGGKLRMNQAGDIIATLPSSAGPDYKPVLPAKAASAKPKLGQSLASLQVNSCINSIGFNICE